MACPVSYIAAILEGSKPRRLKQNWQRRSCLAVPDARRDGAPDLAEGQQRCHALHPITSAKSDG